MQFVFLAAYRVLGISQTPDSPDLELFLGSNPTTRVLITSDLDRHWFILDRHAALGTMMLRGMLGMPQAHKFEERLEQEIQAVRKQKPPGPGIGGVLIIEIKGESSAVVGDQSTEKDDFVVCFDAYDKEALRTQLQNRTSAIVAALRIASDGTYDLEKIGDGSYLLSSEGKVIHSFSPKMGNPTLYVSRQMRDEGVLQVRADINLLLKENKLDNVMRLFAHSLDRKTDSFRTFVSAWSALELFIAKVFPFYEEMLHDELSKGHVSPGLTKYLSRIKEVMKGKYSLTDKFTVISVFLDPTTDSKDITQFTLIKKVRDNLFHGDDISDSSLPNDELHALFEKYFRNHIRRNGASTRLTEMTS